MKNYETKENENAPFTEQNSKLQSKRIYFIDWLRVIAILSVFFYHCNRFFDYRNYPIQTAVRSLASTIHRDFFQIWMMPLFFVISGASVYYALKSRKTGTFVKDRFLRLLVPLVTIGIFIIAPPQIYVERLMNGQFSGSFIAWYPHYFNGVYPYGNFAFQGMHLWYLMELFFYTLIFLPLFIPISKDKTSIISRISFLFEKPWILLLLFLPLAVVVIFAEKLGLAASRIMGGWDPFSYLIFFIYGYLIFSNTQIQENIKKYSFSYIIAACILTIFHLYIEFGINSPEISGVTRHNLVLKAASSVEGLGMLEMTDAWCGLLIFRSLLAWCWIIGLIGIGSRFLNFKNKILNYCNEAVLPFYILHQTVLLVIGYYIIQWNIGNGLKYLAITISSFAVIMIIYELLVRRINVLRFLFGMKLKR